MANKKRLGELLVQQNTVTQDVVDEALQVQVGGNRRLGNILVHMGAITEDQLASILSEQLDIPLTNIDDAFSPDVKNIMPRYLCTKYGAIPLKLKDNNILLTAMSDPSDQSAITDIEDYTGKVVHPCLANQSNIQQAISRKIPYSLKDTFNPQTSTNMTRIAVTVALALVVTLGVTTYNYIQNARYGTIKNLETLTRYDHHDLTLWFNKSGKISLTGHGAYAEGLYSASFNNIPTLRTFIDSREKDLSQKQDDWLKWVLATREKSSDHPDTNLIANGH